MYSHLVNILLLSIKGRFFYKNRPLFMFLLTLARLTPNEYNIPLIILNELIGSARRLPIKKLIKHLLKERVLYERKYIPPYNVIRDMHTYGIERSISLCPRVSENPAKK